MLDKLRAYKRIVMQMSPMAYFQLGVSCGVVCATALFVGAGSYTNDRGSTELWHRLRNTTEFRLDGSRIEVDRWDLTHLAPVGDEEVTLVARGMAFTCANLHDEAPDLGISIRADIHIFKYKELPLGEPIHVNDVVDPSAPIEADLSVFALNGCLVWKGFARGTVTMNALDIDEDPEKSVLRGSFDLHTEMASSKCASERGMRVQARWTSFERMSQALCVSLPEERAAGAPP